MIAYGDFAIELRCARQEPRAWLREFLGATFDDATGTADASIELVLDPGRYAELARPTGAVREIECFTCDGRFQRLPGWGATVLHDPEARVIQVVRDRSVTVIAEEDHYKARATLLRVVRELATADALRRGWLHVHCAAVAIPPGVVAFAGPRRSGKTTLLLHALLAGARYVTNDRLFVDADGTARGMPTIVSVREGSLARFRLGERARRFDRRWTLAELAAGAPPEGTSLSPAQLCALTGAEATGSGPLAAIVFPCIDPAPGFDLRPSGDAGARLEGGLMLADPTERPPEAYGSRFTRGREERRQLCDAVAALVPCFDLRLGPDAYDRPVWSAINAAVASPAP